jgi:hypothetical protein
MNLCVLKSGGDFKPEHVRRLASMVPDLFCISDVFVHGVPIIPMHYNWPSWWCKMEMFRPDIEGDIFYFDLDTTVIEMPEIPKGDCVLTDFGNPNVIGSGLMYLTEQTRARIWDHWIKATGKHINQNITLGDQGYLNQHLHLAERWQRIAKVYSYKRHGKPADAQVICFHGKPRPWEIENAL